MEVYLRHGGGLIGYDPNPLLPPHIQTQIQAGKKTQNPWKISFKMNVQSQGLFNVLCSFFIEISNEIVLVL